MNFLESKNLSNEDSSSSSHLNKSTNLDNISDASLHCPQFKIYNSTSSVFVEHSMSNPDNDQVLYCISAIIQAQVFEDLLKENQCDEYNFDVFNLEIDLNPENGGDPDEIPNYILDFETLNDNLLREKLIEKKVPTVDTIYRFLAMVMRCIRYSPECNIIALIFFNRLLNTVSISITMQNWRGIWIGSIILAQKVYDDFPMRTSSLTNFLKGVTKKQLRDLEFEYFRLLDYTVNIKLSMYAQFYFDLRQLFDDLVGRNNDKKFSWNSRPIGEREARQLELTNEKSNKMSSLRSGGYSTSSSNNSTNIGNINPSVVSAIRSSPYINFTNLMENSSQFSNEKKTLSFPSNFEKKNSTDSTCSGMSEVESLSSCISECEARREVRESDGKKYRSYGSYESEKKIFVLS